MQKYLMPSKLSRALPHQIVLCAVAFVAILPMLFCGTSCGHDFEFHLLSWLEAANQFAHFGYPHWAFTPAWGAGEPRFIFYPPLSWTLGALLGLVLPWKFVAIAFSWVALSLSGATMHRLASRFVDPNAALLAATLYVVNPYMLFTVYERAAYGELLAAACLPLLFAAILATRVRIVPIAVALALIWLTNAPAGVMSSYALAFVTTVRLTTRFGGHSERGEESRPFVLRPKLRLATTVAAGTALAFALAAFFLVPAVYEQRFVQVNMAVTTGMRPVDHTLFHRMPGKAEDNDYHDDVVRTASLVAVTLLSGIAIAFFFAHRNKTTCHPSRSGGPASTLLSLALLTLLIAFLLTPASLFLWSHVPKLTFLQFPWRLCALLGVTLALTTALALQGRLRSIPYSLFPIPCLLLAAAISLPAWHLFHQPCDSADTVAARVALFHSNLGTDPTDEYTPSWVDGDLVKPGDPPFWLLPDKAPIDSPPPTGAPPGAAPTHLTLDTHTRATVVLNRRQFPLWQIFCNGHSCTPYHRGDGLIALPIPAGMYTIDLIASRTPDQTIGFGVSVVAVLIAGGLGYRRRTKAA